MTSHSAPHDVLESDGFDWEAALYEIDSVIDRKAPLISNREEVLYHTSGDGTAVLRAFPDPTKANGKARQGTRDRFVDSYQKRRKDKNSVGGSVLKENSIPQPGHIGGSESRHKDVSVQIDLEAVKKWVYPVNVPHREYQFSITKQALFSNTLVALPTGLGKTLIAAVVMYNYFRWFPEGKIVFAAPSRPLVMQQIEACHNIVGISQEWTIDMTGQMGPAKRLIFWKSKRVFFVTPQVLEKDIHSGICPVKQLVCLVIDEAHRALGNYSYCVAVRELMNVPVELRILALTATPGSKHSTIQNVINNLCISTLEYRCESDPDVTPYVHSRKLELLEVPLHKDAVTINSVLLEAIRPSVARLCVVGVLYNKDSAAMSPCELLNSREKFREAPPLNLSHAQFGEIEGCFTFLITLYHIRKLLLSHGIRPAYEMLEEKLNHGVSSGFMRRNENIQKAKLVMQQSLSSGSENPKLIKMTEILIDHFKTSDPKQSRVIIFSNFRGSVKDIMNSLGYIGDLVKAAEFIGQSSAGKSLKGQTQKMQQAVLQKFRNGGYNVIVATSIGEEGLDIMEVDLVICFDANVSPLRMIQRMGRTGRKHDGRVVVLACEGSEVKGYLKKQASSKAVRKHMHNGGIKSFDFHSSPRMVPHACKPEVQFVELSIVEYIPRGKKAKSYPVIQSNVLENLKDEEKNLLDRYFNLSEQNSWRPSLIAFPHLQAFPSRVHEVRHSFRTVVMLIDTIQNLRGLSEARKVDPSLQLEGGQLEIDNSEQVNEVRNVLFEYEIPVEGMSCIDTVGVKDENCAPNGGFSVSIDPSDQKVEKCLGNSAKVALEFYSPGGQNTSVIKTSNDSADAVNNIENRLIDAKHNVEFQLPKDGLHNPMVPCGLQNSKCRIGDDDDSEDLVAGSADATCSHMPALDEDSRCNMEDTEFSPRLRHLIENGVVPETPEGEAISSFRKSNIKGVPFIRTPEDKSTVLPRLSSRIPETVSCSEVLENNERTYFPELFDFSPDSPKCPLFSSTMLGSETARKECMPSLGIDRTHVSPANLPNNNSSEECQLNSGERSQPQPHRHNLKRLRKFKDISRNMACNIFTGNSKLVNVDCPINVTPFEVERSEKGTKRKKFARKFIDDEAEVSNDSVASEDEKEGENDDEYDDSFIDDRTSPSTATQGGNTADMVAFYRRSLLTQSPSVSSPMLVSPRKAGVGSCSPRTTSSSLDTPVVGIHQDSNISFIPANSACRLSSSNPAKIQEGVHQTPKESSNKLGSRRKLSFLQPGRVLLPPIHPTFPQTEETALHHRTPHEPEDMPNMLFDDDDFYRSIDLDALEEHVKKLSRNGSKPPVNESHQFVFAQINVKEAKPVIIQSRSMDKPTFDLGV